MNSQLPDSLQKRVAIAAESYDGVVAITPEEYEDLVELLESIVQQNSSILVAVDETIKNIKGKRTGAAAFWDGMFSLWGTLIVSNIAIWTVLGILFS